MKKKIIILGSTGSIGQNTLNVLKNDKKNFQVLLLSTNKNVEKILKQAKEFKVRKIIITDYKKYIHAKKKYKKIKIQIFNKFDLIDKFFNKKNIYYSMVAISGLDGLKPTLQLTKYSKNLAVVNKESLICGWNLIKENLKKYKTNFIPIDSEHFSIFSLLRNNKLSSIDKIYITASGGPFLRDPLKKINKATPKEALNHPNWNMGKKISIDSATMMNKVFEVIEAKNIFDLEYKNISILTHPKSYVHAIVKFNNALIKILIHEPDMKIPIHNSIYQLESTNINSKSLNLDILNNLELKKIDLKRFPLVKILKNLPKKNSLYETVLITINDYFVLKFLNKKISYKNLVKLIYEYSKRKEFQKYKNISVKNVEEIYKLRDYVSLKLDTLGI